MSQNSYTSVSIKNEIKQRLEGRKAPGQSLNGVIEELLNKTKEKNNGKKESG